MIIAVSSKNDSQINKLIIGDGIVWTTCSNQVAPSSTVPFKRDSRFFPRDDIIKKIDTILEARNNNRQAALFGLGGVGQVLFSC